MNRFFLIISLIVLAINSSIAQDQSGYMEVKGKVVGYGKPLSDVTIEVFKDSVSIDKLITFNTGKFVFHFDYNFIFTLEFSKNGYTTKSVKIDTHVPEKEKSDTGHFEFKIDLFVQDSSHSRPPNDPIATISHDESKNYNLGVDKFGLKEYKEAINYFSLSIESKYKLVDSYYNRAACYKKMGDINSACNDWQKAKELGDAESEKLLIKYCEVKTDSIH